MGYDNNGGCCNSGFGFPFGGLMNGFGGFGFDALILLLFVGLMGGGMWGGMGGFGGWGGFGGGAGMLGATSMAATETAALINQQNTADRVAAIGADVRQVLGQTGGIIEAVNTVGNRAQDGFARLDTSLCQMGHAQTMQGMNMHNATTALLNDMRAENAKCCCENKYQAAADKCEIIQSMNANTAAIMARIDCLEKNAMQDKLNAANEKIATLKAERDNSQQTQTLLAAIQANNGCKPACAPAPYGPGYPYGFCNPCVDGIQRAVNDALGARIGEVLFPTTTPAAA